jgi:hypothetical protein
MEVVLFGEKVMYKKLQQTGQRKNILDTDWEEGLLLGHTRTSTEVLIGTAEGVVRAWAVRRKVEDERWSGATIKEMKGTPARPDPNMSGIDIPIRIKVTMDFPNAVAEPIVPQRNEDQSRRAYLKKNDFVKFGYDEDCEGCRKLSAGKAPRPHRETCRLRMEKHLEEEENPRWKRAADAQE